MTGTSFSAKQYLGRDEVAKVDFTEKEHLEEACWNGLLQEIMPEIYQPEGNHKLYLWQVKEGNSFIELELGEAPEEKDSRFSIDPYAFVHLQCLS
jgi:hypothetical protein